MSCSWPAAAPPDCDIPEADPGWFDLAQQILNQITGFRFGQCQQTITVSRRGCKPGFVSLYFGAGWWPTVFTNFWLIRQRDNGCCVMRCDPSGEALQVPTGFTVTSAEGQTPLIGYSTIGVGVIGSTGLDFVQMGDRLFLPVGQTWPDCVVLTGIVGDPPPAALQWAVWILANELALAACGSTECQLPATTQNVVRDGLTFSLADSWPELVVGKTGIRWIDMAVQSYAKTRAGASVWKP